MKKKLLIINTGGTMGMKPTERGFRPAQGFLETQMARMPELHDETMPEFVVKEYDPVLDSANFTPLDWQRMAGDIADHYQDFDAFLLLHGTDTMAYTASALPLMLEGVDKPVILTGSQLPLCLRRNDARENLITAMIIATEFPVPEVCVYFGSRLLRGCRTTKASTSNFDAFDSPNEPPLGLVGTHIQVFARRIRQRPPADRTQKALAVRDIRPAKLATFRLFPGVTPDVLDNVLQTPLQGMVLESYGAGNGPSNDRAFLSTLRSAVERGVTIVNLSQCQHGGVSQNDYATGRALTDVGVISGGDMTVEAAITKLMFLFSQNLSVDQVKRQMAKNLVGELSEPLTTS